MKKIAMLMTALLVSAGLMFAQAPQTKEKGKTAPATETKAEKKEVKTEKVEHKHMKHETSAPTKTEKKETVSVKENKPVEKKK